MQSTIIKNEIDKIRSKDRRTIALRYDVMFKAVFMRNKDVLLKMIKDLFEVEDSYDPITIVGFETVPANKSGKTYRSDLLVMLSDKSYVLIEMNNSNGIEAIDRNLVQLVRIHGQVLKGGTKDTELSSYRLRGINFNNFRNDTGKPIDTFAFCNIGTGKIVSFIYSFCNVDIVKCKELVYDINVHYLPKAVRWGAILKEENIDKISDILGKDMLSMEEKERLLKTIEEVNNDTSILSDWVLVKLAEEKEQDQINYAKEEGAEEKNKEVIINMLEEGTDYDFISKVTGKTIDEIKGIEENIK